MQFADIYSAFFVDQFIGNVDSDNFAKDHCVLEITRGVGQVQVMDELALEVYWRFCNSGRVTSVEGSASIQPRPIRPRPSMSWRMKIHGIAHIPGDEIVNKLARFNDVTHAILNAIFFHLAITGREHYRWWAIADPVEKRIGSEVDVTLAVDRADPPDWPGDD